MRLASLGKVVIYIPSFGELHKTDSRHLVHNLLRYPFPAHLAPVHLGLYDLHEKPAGSFLECAVVFGIVWAVVSPAQPCWFGVRDLAEVAWRGRFDAFCLSMDSADLETLVLRTEEDLVAVETEEGVCCVFSSWEGGLGRVW